MSTIEPATTPPPAKQKFLTRKVPVQMWVLILAGLVLLGALASTGDKPSETPLSGGLPLTSSQDRPTQDRPSTPAVNYDALAADDISITLVETSKQCFGSAGCNVEFEPELKFVKSPNLKPGSKWQVIYEVVGAEDPFTSTIDVTIDSRGKGQYTYDSWNHVSTKRSSDVLTANITAVRSQL